MIRVDMSDEYNLQANHELVDQQWPVVIQELILTTLSTIQQHTFIGMVISHKDTTNIAVCRRLH